MKIDKTAIAKAISDYLQSSVFLLESDGFIMGKDVTLAAAAQLLADFAVSACVDHAAINRGDVMERMDENAFKLELAPIVAQAELDQKALCGSEEDDL